MTEELRKVIEESENIILLPSPELKKDTFPATLALFSSLKKLGKNVKLIAENYPARFKFLLKKDDLYFPGSDFLISIKEAGVKLSQIFYEKTEQGLNLYLKTNQGELKKEDISLNPLRPEHLLITLGLESIKKVKNLLKEEGESEVIINIDNKPENEKYGQINLIEESYPSFSEIVFEFLQSIDENLFDADVSNSLLAGIIQETSNLQNPKLSPKTFQKIAYLMSKGGDFKKITSSLYKLKPGSSFGLFKRILSKLELADDKNLGWVVLKEKDFQETNSTPSDLPFTFEKLTSSIFPFQNFLCLWEYKSSPTFVRGVFYSPDKNLVKKIEDYFQGLKKGNGILFQTDEKNLQKIKERVWELL